MGGNRRFVRGVNQGKCAQQPHAADAVAPHLTVVHLEPMIEIIGWNEKCVQNALKLCSSTCF
jgi:hypothetical protein